jgi:predicted RNA-binding Zn ribbon-like protein
VGDEPMTSAPLLGEPIAVELMNTIWAERGVLYDSLADVADVDSWLSAVRDRLAVPGEAVAAGVTTKRVATRLRSLRDALRALAAIATDDDRPAAIAHTAVDRDAAIADLNHACSRALSWPELSWAGGKVPQSSWHSARPGSEVAISLIAEQAVQLFAGPQFGELRACHGPGCVLYFVRDQSRREWCSASCGNRARVARHYQRHHGN